MVLDQEKCIRNNPPCKNKRISGHAMEEKKVEEVATGIDTTRKVDLSRWKRKVEELKQNRYKSTKG